MPISAALIEKTDSKHLNRNQMEFAGLVIYLFVLAVVYVMAAVLMLLGSGAARHS